MLVLILIECELYWFGCLSQQNFDAIHSPFSFPFIGAGLNSNNIIAGELYWLAVCLSKTLMLFTLPFGSLLLVLVLILIAGELYWFGCWSQQNFDVIDSPFWFFFIGAGLDSNIAGELYWFGCLSRQNFVIHSPFWFPFIGAGLDSNSGWVVLIWLFVLAKLWFFSLSLLVPFHWCWSWF